MHLFQLPVLNESILFTTSVETSPVTIGVTGILATIADSHAVKKKYNLWISLVIQLELFSA